jgi:hypothetical protein
MSSHEIDPVDDFYPVIHALIPFASLSGKSSLPGHLPSIGCQAQRGTISKISNFWSHLLQSPSFLLSGRPTVSLDPLQPVEYLHVEITLSEEAGLCLLDLVNLTLQVLACCHASFPISRELRIV